MAKVALNGLGRIGRATLKIVLDRPELELVAANDLIDLDNLAYLLQYDSVYGRYRKSVRAADGRLEIDGKSYMVFHEKDPANLPWRELDIDVVFECTGVFTKEEDLRKHANAGARHVILSAPSKTETLTTVVYGTSRPEKRRERIVSCASCTTNCITPVIEVLDRRIGVEKATMTTVHAYTSSQSLVDGPNRKFRRGRAAAMSFVPTSTGAAIATTKVLPELAGKFDGAGIRGPVPVGSIADIVCLTKRATTVDEVNLMFREEAGTDRYREVLGIAEDPVVSADIIGDSRASIVDLTLTQVVDGDLVKVMSWYDNEWGYANQMVRHAIAMVLEPREMAAG